VHGKGGARGAEAARRTARPTPPGGAREAAARAAALLPSGRDLLDPRGPFLIPALLLLVTRAVTWLQIPGGAEDAYITFRYARDLATGHGLVYNPGERVMGFSSPLWTVWNALGILLIHDPLPWARASAVLADLVTLLAMGRLLTRHASRAAAWCFAVFFAMWPYFPAVSMSGMESAAMLALLCLAASLTDAGSAASGIALGALALTRPEGIAAAAVLALGARWRARAIAAAIAGAGLLALWLYFGTVVPQSLVAKALTYGAPGPWAGRVWWDWLLPFPLGHWPRLGDTVMMSMMAVVVAPAVVLGAIALARQPRTALAAAAGAALVVWLGYAVLGVSYFWWYFAVPLAGFAMLAAVGLPRLTRGPALYVSLVLLVSGIWSNAYNLYLGRWEEEARSFGAAADFLASHARPGEKVMLEPIGTIGYVAPVVVVDEVGLVFFAVAQRRRQGPGWYSDVVEAERPDWIVIRRGVLAGGAAYAGAGAPFRSPAEREALFAGFVRDTVIDEPAAGDNALVILQRAP
jgi:hypothetical protein